MIIRKLSFYLLLIFIYSCASIKAPPGGPVDETPPVVEEVFPASGSVNLVTREIVVKFSEYMDEKSFAKNIKVFPHLPKPLEYKFKGDEIILLLPDSLDSANTYIFNLNRSIQDEHRIPLANTVQLAYSTGENISNGVISGKIYGSGEKSIHLWKITDTVIDSLFATLPDYITDVNDDGYYSFNYLAQGNYQVLAVEKSGASLPLDPTHTGYGLHWQDKLNLTENDTLSNINMRLMKEPQKLKLLRGEWSAFNWGKLIFNNELPRDLIVDLKLESESGNYFDPPQYYLDPMDQKNLVVQLSDSIESNSIKTFIESLKFDGELRLDSAEVIIQIQQEPDTSYLKILNPTTNYRILSNSLTIAALNITFSRPVQLSPDSIYIPKLFKNDSVPVNVDIKRINPMQYKLIPLLKWDENEKYQLRINRDGILVENGRGLKDSVSIFNLHTTQNTGYGTVIGKINNVDDLNLVVELFSTKNPSLSHSSIVNSESKFELETIPEGNYSLYFFKDNNKDMKYNFGNAYPNIPSEWFYFYPDTFEIRTNWETEIAPINLLGNK